ncbi:hypothetical protein AB4K20DRAFT_1983237 [Rhizopus microsporus]|uniref:Uncharacterized protein n=1 Tax=Rhizopus microsporus TaxID=58291 RepID=A0A1X0RQD5_RHIZD|nr:hypothetical protein BCV71DRAFT_238595 [Rhizopus microsporus]
MYTFSKDGYLTGPIRNLCGKFLCSSQVYCCTRLCNDRRSVRFIGLQVAEESVSGIIKRNTDVCLITVLWTEREGHYNTGSTFYIQTVLLCALTILNKGLIMIMACFVINFFAFVAFLEHKVTLKVFIGSTSLQLFLTTSISSLLNAFLNNLSYKNS